MSLASLLLIGTAEVRVFNGLAVGGKYSQQAKILKAAVQLPSHKCFCNAHRTL